ncbi:LysR family transcriptional regulator [Streptomyces sp. NBC_01476]|uniref:LysR family transcriptional regulator n=1 Tax=Streptomyces sp. NBC_01476 TaxID=2903881 RepID=UPI002E3164D4|nr:LysR family transcriptional regulator [Streptomyces sp. NBC_01476]
MELRSLEIFVAVAEENSFTRAAERCRVSQPTVSHHISGLEKEVGEPLFDRDRRTVSLSDGGHTLLPYARACLASARDAGEAFANRSRAIAGALNLGTVEGVEWSPLPGVLRQFHDRHPAVRVRLQSGTTAPLLAQVAQGQLDAAITARPLDDLPHGLLSKVILADEIMALVGRDTQAAGEGLLDLAQVVDERLITYDESSGLQAIIRRAFGRSGRELRPAFSTNDVPLQVALAEAGIGVALSAGSDPAVISAAGVVPLRLDPPIVYEKIMVWQDRPLPSPLGAFMAVWDELASDETWTAPSPRTS